MSKANVFALSVNARYDAAQKEQLAETSLKMISKLALYVSQKKVADFLKASNVSADFASDSRIANKMICAKALNRANVILQFAMNEQRSKLDECSNACIRTMLLHAKHNEAFDLRDFDLTLDASQKVSDERKHLFFKRSTVFNSVSRHSQMTMRALSALNCVSYDAQSRKFKMNDNAITQALSERLAA